MKATIDNLSCIFRLSDIPCVAIRGHVKPSGHVPGDSLNQHIPNHVWNAVYINTTWRLVDVTWGSGYMDQATGTYCKQSSSHYLFTEPRTFIKTHRPLHSKWQLLQDTVSLQQFSDMPVYGHTFHQYNLKTTGLYNGLVDVKYGSPFIFLIECDSYECDMTCIYGILRHKSSGLAINNRAVNLHQPSQGSVYVTVMVPFPDNFVLELYLKSSLQDSLLLMVAVKAQPPAPCDIMTDKYLYTFYENITTFSEINGVSGYDIIPDKIKPGIYHINIKTPASVKVKLQYYYIKETQVTQGINNRILQRVNKKPNNIEIAARQGGVYKLVFYGRYYHQNKYTRLCTLIKYISHSYSF